MKELTDYSLLHHNTFGMDVRTAHFVEYESVEELCAFLKQKIMNFHYYILEGEVICSFRAIIKEQYFIP